MTQALDRVRQTPERLACRPHLRWEPDAQIGLVPDLCRGRPEMDVPTYNEPRPLAAIQDWPYERAGKRWESGLLRWLRSSKQFPRFDNCLSTGFEGLRKFHAAAARVARVK